MLCLPTSRDPCIKSFGRKGGELMLFRVYLGGQKWSRIIEAHFFFGGEGIFEAEFRAVIINISYLGLSNNHKSVSAQCHTGKIRFPR